MAKMMPQNETTIPNHPKAPILIILPNKRTITLQ